MEETQKQEVVQWYVMNAVFRKEIKIRDDMRRAGFDCYVPMRYEIKTVRGKKERQLNAAVHELLFVRSTKSKIMEYKIHSKDALYFRMSGRSGNRDFLVVPDKQMDDFIRVTQHVEKNLTYFHPDEINLRVGDKIKIHGGVFDGVEGVLMRLPGKRKKQLVVSIPEISSVAITLSPDVVEVIDQPVKKSTDIEGDMKRLFTMAFQKLFAPPDRQTQENEYNMLIMNLEKTLGSLSLCKGYTASREAEISLAVYMATKALGQDDAIAKQRILVAMEALKDTSMLKLRLKLYYAELAPDAELADAVKAKVKEWRSKPLSEQQRKTIEEIHKVMSDSL